MNPQNIQNMQNIPYPDNIICLYSKFSPNCKRFSSVAGPKIPIIKFVCIDNEKVRQKVLANLSIQVQVVPCILLTYSNGVIEKFDGENAFRWAAGIIQKMERPQVQEQFQAQAQPLVQAQPQEQMQLQAQPQPQPQQAQLQATIATTGATAAAAASTGANSNSTESNSTIATYSTTSAHVTTIYSANSYWFTIVK